MSDTRQKPRSGYMLTYDISLLMAQTRRVAADYHQTTGQALPVTAELARFDAIDKLNLQKLEGENGVDAIQVARIENATGAAELVAAEERYLIKGRVIFKGGKARQKLGQINLDGQWDCLLMVLYDGDYEPTQIYKISRAVIETEVKRQQKDKPKDKRGSMTVAKYKAIGDLVWAPEEPSAATSSRAAAIAASKSGE